MSFFRQLSDKYPDLRKKLLIAHLDKKPEEYIKEKVMSAAYMASGVAVMTFFLMAKNRGNAAAIGFAVLSLLLSFLLFYSFLIRHIDALIKRRAKDIDKEVLFAGRFLLVKLNTGVPLINALIEASKSYGVANKYFKEIVRDIELGTSLEEALEKASYYTPSEKFKRILFQILNAVRIGIDVSDFIQSILDEISQQQLIEIQRYGKKLNSITLFYMLMAIVLPSLGVTIFIVVASLVSVQVDLVGFGAVLFFLIILQLIFLSFFKFIRPNVNI